MKDDEIVLAVCNRATANFLIQNDAKIKDSLVVTEIVEDGRIIIIPEQEFLDYLDGKE